MRVDLNCDLGEGEAPARTRALMRWIGSANVACGGHAGSVESMRACARWARQFGVRCGAHPGPWSRGDFGRGGVPAEFGPADLELLLLQQVGAFERLAREEGVRLSHIKLHGALYHAVEREDRLARAYLRAVQQHWPRCAVYALAGGRVARLGPAAGVSVWGEAFADRGYRGDGGLVPRGEPGALLERVADVLARVRAWASGGRVTAMDGTLVTVPARTWCVHGDGPEALNLVRALGREMRR